jgi:hypothetical protein
MLFLLLGSQLMPPPIPIFFIVACGVIRYKSIVGIVAVAVVLTGVQGKAGFVVVVNAVVVKICKIPHPYWHIGWRIAQIFAV